MKYAWLLVIGFTCAQISSARAEWINISKNMNEANAPVLTLDPKNSDVLFAASDRRVYKTLNGGGSWHEVMGLRGSDSKITCLYIDPDNPTDIYAASTHGVRKSHDSGNHWDSFYTGVGDAQSQVYCVTTAPGNPSKLWFGAGNGIIVLDKKGSDAKPLSSISGVAVYKIHANNLNSGIILAGTSRGIFKSIDQGLHWERALVTQKMNDEDMISGLDVGYDDEETPMNPYPTDIVYFEPAQMYLASTDQGMLESPGGDATNWKYSDVVKIPEHNINCLAISPGSFYIATDRGIFQGDPRSTALRDISEGLPTKEVKKVIYDERDDCLFAATPRGIFRLNHPECAIFYQLSNEGMQNQLRSILKNFELEPSIHAIQDAAIRYAEVHPKKIEEWRAAASRKALLPTLSFNHSISTHDNVDIDRGGTADPDKFIIGPRENSYDWYAGLSWNLGELIWNNDQTSIDTRSRLMVELRNDVLNEVTHLYYERRRLQIEMMMSPVKDLSGRLEKELRLQELTANIDALTGGFLSKKLQELNTLN